MLRWYYSVDAVTVLEITDRVRKPGPDGSGGISVGSHAEEGSGWEGTINVDDEQGDLILLMHRRIYCVQDAAPVDHQVVGNWFISGLDVIRGTPPVLASRIWVVQMADENSLLSRRVFVGIGNNRPAETDIDRIRWLLTTTELNTLDPDETFIDTANPVPMDAVDYIGQKPEQVLSDCSQQSGKNYWVMYREDLTPNVYGLAYFDANTSDLYPSTVGLSNVESEVDDSTVFAISDDTRLNRAGGRSPTSGMYLPYAGGYVYEQDTDVGDTYVYRDVAAPSVNVKTAPKATARAVRLLAELDEPDDEVETEIIVEEDHLNDAMNGMLIPLRATHLPNYTEDSDGPGYATGTDMRIMRRQIRQLGPTTFGNRMWLSPTVVPVTPQAVLYRAQTDARGDVGSPMPIAYVTRGDDGVAIDEPYLETIGPLTPYAYTTPNGHGNWGGWDFSGTGTIDLEGYFTFFSPIPGETLTVQVLINGSPVASASCVQGSTCDPGDSLPLVATGIAIVPGDRLSTRVLVGGNYIDKQALEITGGSLVP